MAFMPFDMILAAVLLAQGPPASGPQNVTATLSVQLGSQTRISIASSTLTFPDAPPDLVPQVPANPASMAITAKARTTRDAQTTLTVQAADDLRSGVTTLPAALITWNAEGAGFMPGTLSAGTAHVVAAWTGSGVRSGSQSYFFENRWTHPPGVYSLTLIYTVSAP